MQAASALAQLLHTPVGSGSDGYDNGDNGESDGDGNESWVEARKMS